MFLNSQTYFLFTTTLAFILFSNKSLAVLDEDYDGMSDVWQRVYNISSFDIVSDPDKDGFTNLQEAQAGTNPNDKNDYFRMINHLIKPEAGKVDLTWRSLEDRSYDIQITKDLISWNNLHQLRGVSGRQSSVSLEMPTLPLNDNFESRLPSSDDAEKTIGHNKNSSFQAGEPNEPSASGQNSVWWTWKPSLAGEVTITTNGSDFDTTLAIYTGDALATLVLIGSDDDGGLDFQSSVTFTADPSKVYSIQVKGYSDQTGNITLNHPVSAGAFDQPVAADAKFPRIFFRVKGDQHSDRDTDGDGMVVWEERLLGTDPNKADTDGDGMNDDSEFKNEFDPQDPADGALDTDGDGISNADEMSTETDPRNPDSDGNGINDSLEDLDGDTLTNGAEVNIHNTDPRNSDSDGDQMPDNWEIEHGLDPNKADGENGQDGDPDGDGVSNFDEYLNGTDPQSTDTDQDGVDDNVEIEQGSDPNDSTDEGKPPKEALRELAFRIGDPSGSHSENWLLCIRGIGEDPDTRNLKVKGKDFGVMSDPKPFKLRVGKSYEITIQHLGSKSGNYPDYDWEATIDGLPNGVAEVIAAGEGFSANEVFVAGGYWIVDNREAVLTKEKHGNESNIVAGKKAYLRPIEIVPDYNRDGKIDLADRGRVTEENPWRWWINDDNDVTNSERGENLDDVPYQDPSVRDCNDLKIDGMRDHLDFFPIYLDIENALKVFPQEGYDYVLKNAEGALHYYEYPGCIIDGSDPDLQLLRNLKLANPARVAREKDLKLISQEGVSLTTNMINRAKQGHGVILVEGAKLSEASLTLTIVKKEDLSEKIEIKLPLNIVDVKYMFRQLNLRSLTGSGGGEGGSTYTDEPFKYPDHLTNGKYLVYIHGFNVTGKSASGSQANIFKRMHQMGSKARFIGIYWNGTPPMPAFDSQYDYHRAVYNGFLTGEQLKDKLSFVGDSSLTIMAHSLGNIPVSHAIANAGLTVDQYYMIDAAVPIEAYDATQISNSNEDTTENENMPRRMTENNWKSFYDYQNNNGEHSARRLFAAHWYQLFDEADNRSKLTWKNIFAKPELLSVAYNFYSTGEEVVENADETESFGGNIITYGFVRHAWVQQEMAKGGQNGAAHPTFHDLNGGWVFAKNYGETFSGGNSSHYNYLRAHETDHITNEELKTKPFYQPFLYPELYDPAQGSATAGDDHKRYKVLATGVPAMSYAAAANSIGLLEDYGARNYNMQHDLKSINGQSSWPELDNKHPQDWGHSDFKDVSLQFVYPMYEKMIELGNLNQN